MTKRVKKSKPKRVYPYYNRDYDSPEYKKWRLEVFKLCGFKCVVCGQNKKLRAHHLYSWADNIHTRFISKLGVTLCDLHHGLFHEWFGRGHNRPDQFSHYCQIMKVKPPTYLGEFETEDLTLQIKKELKRRLKGG